MIEARSSEQNHGQRSLKSVNILDTLKSENFKKAVGKIIPLKNQTERLTAIALSQVKQNPKLQTCCPQTVARSVARACELGLSLGVGGQSFLVPFGNECTLIIGYRGLMTLMFRTGLLKVIDPGVVRSSDEFEFWKDDKIHFFHKPNFKEKTAPIERFYARAELSNGGFTVALLEIEDALLLKDKADKKALRSKEGCNTFWRDHFEEMGKKSAIIRLAKVIPEFHFLDKILEPEYKMLYEEEDFSLQSEGKFTKSDRLANQLSKADALEEVEREEDEQR